MSRTRSKAAVSVGAILTASALMLTGCTSSGTTSGSTANVSAADIDKAMNTPTTITFWSWLPDMQSEVNLFEKKYPKIHVSYQNAGQGATEYTKLRTVIKAGRGQPDATQIEFQYLPSFQSYLLDFTPYGFGSLKSQFVSSIWGQVAIDGGLYGIPQDYAPMGNLYRHDLFTAAGITQAPATWDEYMADAKIIKAKTGNYISDLPGNDGGQFLSLMWQAGARPFAYDGKKTVTVNIESPEAKKVVDYWNSMIKQGLVDTAPDFNNDWYQGFVSGKYAGWLVPAWGPDNLTGTVAKTSGDWTTAPLPQWDPSNPASSYWGGSSDAVLKTSKHPIVAAELVKFLNTGASALQMATSPKQTLFPPTLAVQKNPAFVEQKSAFFNGQQVNKLYLDIAKTVDPKFGWLPYMDFVYSNYSTTLGKAIADKTDLETGLAAWQAAVVAYGKQQGFTVKTN